MAQTILFVTRVFYPHLIKKTICLGVAAHITLVPRPFRGTDITYLARPISGAFVALSTHPIRWTDITCLARPPIRTFLTSVALKVRATFGAYLARKPRVLTLHTMPIGPEDLTLPLQGVVVGVLAAGGGEEQCECCDAWCPASGQSIPLFGSG